MAVKYKKQIYALSEITIADDDSKHVASDVLIEDFFNQYVTSDVNVAIVDIKYALSEIIIHYTSTKWTGSDVSIEDFSSKYALSPVKIFLEKEQWTGSDAIIEDWTQKYALSEALIESYNPKWVHSPVLVVDELSKWTNSPVLIEGVPQQWCDSPVTILNSSLILSGQTVAPGVAIGYLCYISGPSSWSATNVTSQSSAMAQGVFLGSGYVCIYGAVDVKFVNGLILANQDIVIVSSSTGKATEITGANKPIIGQYLTKVGTILNIANYAASKTCEVLFNPEAPNLI